jgi:site-specific DNA-methyltransferase (adenine-specific)
MESVFPGVDFEGGVSYFLWDRDNEGDCTVSYHLGDEEPVTVQRDLSEFDVFVRDPEALEILRKVLKHKEPSITEIMGTNNEFALGTNFRAFEEERSTVNDVAVHVVRSGRRTVGWMRRADLPRGQDLVDVWKVLIPKSYGERGTYPAQVLGPILIAEPPSASTQTYVFVRAGSEHEARSIASYTQTRFFRFLLSLRKITQHAARPVYTWVPQQNWDRDWTDEALYKKYELTAGEIALIEKMIRPSSSNSGTSHE